MSVEADFAAWLRSDRLNATARDEASAAAWGDLAVTAELLSALSNKADAQDEAARQIALFGAPIVVETLQVDGLHVGLFGRPVTLTAARQGYDGGATVFVIAARELDRVERTNLTVLRKLG